MTAFVFIFVYYLGKRIFTNFGISDRNRFCGFDDWLNS